MRSLVPSKENIFTFCVILDPQQRISIKKEITDLMKMDIKCI